MIIGIRETDQALFDELMKVYQFKSIRNILKQKYYDGKMGLNDLGISIPPDLKSVDTVVGWPAKAVDMLAVRSIFDGFITSDGQQIDFLSQVLKDNQFKVMYRHAVISELINSVSFLTVSKGLEGEPSTLISVYSAHDAAALWDGRKKRIKAGLTIAQRNKQGQPEVIYLYTDTDVVEIIDSGSTQRAIYHPHAQGRPLMEPLRYSPSVDRPFGKSRISRAVMSITDSAVRTALRTEVAAEFYTTPQRYLLGADETVFEDQSKWEAYVGSIFAVTKDEDGDTPQYGQLPQMSMQPHIDYMRSLAARFAGETGVPISSLGVIHDNPASAEAIYAAREDLIIEANNLNETNGEALKNIALLVMAIELDTTVSALPDDLKTVQAKFKNASMPSVVSQSDAMVKQASIMPWIGETEVALEMLGYTEDQIIRLKSQRRQAQALQTLSGLIGKDTKTGIANRGDADEYDTAFVG